MAGEFFYHGGDTPPDGALVRTGALVSRTAYAALFAAIGTKYGAGDGVTTFALPDHRGEFERAADLGRGVDPGREVGSGQAATSIADMPYSGTSGGTPSAGLSNGDGADSSVTYFRISGGTVSATIGRQFMRPRNVAALPCISYRT